MSTKETNVETADAANVETTQVTKKKLRRGISNDTRATSRKKFDERRDIKPNNLFLGHLENVEVRWSTYKEDAGIASFQGMSVPRLVFTFASNEKDATDRKYHEATFNPVESTVDTIPGGKNAWQVDNIFSFMKHVLDVFVLKGRPMTEEEEDLLTLPFEDFDENMQFIPLEAQEILDGYKVLFENYVKFINHDGKPYYNTDKGTPIPIWMKLLRFTKVRGAWRAVVGTPKTSNYGDLGFPSFIGSGVIELYRGADVPAGLIVDASKESVIFKEVEEAKQPNAGMPGAPVMPAAGVIGTGVMPQAGAPVGPASPTAANNLADDLPF